ncbi:MAG: hypothetical protein J6W37_07220 [Bacteroidales bacterium]|nr:hypothetical protein [Bacteroidales bacterium]
MKKIVLLLSLLVATICVSAQSARVIFISGGFSFLTDGYMSMTNLKPDDRNTKVKAEESYQYLQWNFVSGILAARITLIPITLNSSISVSAAPTISVGAIYPVHNLGSRYGLNAEVPVYLELNLGAASRYVASKDWGLCFGAGIEYFASPLCSYDFSDTGYNNSDFMKTWILPSCKIGYRYWSKKNKVNEVILRVGFGEKSEDFYTFDEQTSKQYRPMHVGLSFLKILNY